MTVARDLKAECRCVRMRSMARKVLAYECGGLRLELSPLRLLRAGKVVSQNRNDVLVLKALLERSDQGISGMDLLAAGGWQPGRDASVMSHCVARLNGLAGSRLILSGPGGYHVNAEQQINAVMSQGLRVEFLDLANPEHKTIFAAAIACAGQLFPRREERPDPNDKYAWLLASHLSLPETRVWHEHYACLLDGDEVVGVADVSAKSGQRLCIMSYFGVKGGWRNGGTARFFFQEVQAGLRSRMPFVDTALFEVEPIDWNYLQHLRASPDLSSAQRSYAEAKIRTLARLVVFSANHALAALQQDGTPMPYWEPLAYGEGRELILMLLPASGPVVTVTEAIDFVYDNVYGEAYDEELNLPEFRDQALRLKRRVEQRMNGCYFGRYPIPRSLAHLLLWAENLGLSADL